MVECMYPCRAGPISAPYLPTDGNAWAKKHHVQLEEEGKHIGLRFHDLRRTGIRNMSMKAIPENIGMLISGHRTSGVYRRYNIIDMDVIKGATATIEEHQPALGPQNNHRTATNSDQSGAGDKTEPVN